MKTKILRTLTKQEYVDHCAEYQRSRETVRELFVHADPDSVWFDQLYFAWKFMEKRHKKWVETTEIKQ